jgi:SAM-dependent methyltransferase
MNTVGRETLLVMNKAGLYNNWLFSFMDEFVKGDILEVGSGVGSFTRLLREKGNVTTIDKNKKYVEKLKKELTNVSVGFGDIEKGRHFFSQKKFDTVVCLNVLEHVENDFKALGNIYNLMTRGAKLILLVPAHRSLYCKFDKKLGHYRRYDIKNVTKTLKKVGFRVLDMRCLNWLGAVGWYVFMKVMKVERFPKSRVLLFEKISRLFLSIEKVVRFPFGLSVFTVSEKI